MNVFVKLLSVAAILLFLSSCDIGKDSPKVRADGEPVGGGSLQNANIFNQPGIFYRMEADFKWLETGEILKFDYVASCYNHDTPGSYSPSLLPSSFFLPTSTGAAVQLKTIGLCWNGGNWPDDPEVGDPWPFAIVYDDVKDLRFGFGYPNYHAYENPNSKIKFLRGAVTKTNRQAFMEWYKKAEDSYVQIGALPGPHGAQTNPNREKRERNKRINHGNDNYDAYCSGFARIPVSIKVADVIRRLAPEGSGRFYTVFPQKYDVPRHKNQQALMDLEKDLILGVADIDGEGRPMSHYTYPIQAGVVGKEGKGSFYKNKRDYTYAVPVYYPLTGDYYPPRSIEPHDKVVTRTMHLDNEHAGYVACGGKYNRKKPPKSNPRGIKDGLSWVHYIGSEPQKFHLHGADIIYDTQGAVFVGESKAVTPQPIRYYPLHPLKKIKTEGLK